MSSRLIVVRLPTFDECFDKHEAKENLTDLEQFILNNEPVSPADKEWRQHLSDVLSETINEDRFARLQPRLTHERKLK